MNHSFGFRVVDAVIFLGIAVCLLLPAPSATAQTFSVVHDFAGDPSDGAYPSGPPLIDAKGNLYGASLGGSIGQGAIYKITTKGKESVIYSFKDGTDGDIPSLSFVESTAVFGTTHQAGVNGFGTVFKFAEDKLTVLYSPPGAGAFPGGVIRDTNGSLYGTTYAGGDFNACYPTGCGTIFKVTTPGNARFTHIFGQNSGDGEVPNGWLVHDRSGTMLGTTQFGGASGYGTVFKIGPAGRESVIYSLSGGADGGIPTGGLYRDAQGNLYGTASQGGGSNQGTVFKITNSGHFAVLYSFSGTDGSMPTGELTRDEAGNLYGVTYQGGRYNLGTVFRLDAEGNLTVLHDFSGADGEYPVGLLLANGVLYGATYQGGASNFGVVFKLIP